jgi:MFS family permease
MSIFIGGLAYAGEGSVGDWSAVYLVIDLHTNPVIGVLGFAVFQLMTAIGRYYLDAIVDYIDRTVLLQIAGVLACMGLGLVGLAPSLPSSCTVSIVILGFGVSGIGLSTVAPIIIYYAGKLDIS